MIKILESAWRACSAGFRRVHLSEVQPPQPWPKPGSAKRTCIECSRWSFYGGSRGYSEWTPGDGWSMECLKGHWKMEGVDTREEEFYKTLSAAATCKDFTPVSKEEQS